MSGLQQRTTKNGRSVHDGDFRVHVAVDHIPLQKKQIPEPAACLVTGLTRRAAWFADTTAVSRAHHSSAYPSTGETGETYVHKASLERLPRIQRLG